MLTLGIETSERFGSIALWRDDCCLAEKTLAAKGRRHAQSLVSEIDLMFRRLQKKPRDCDAVAVSIGPGSFTGLRVGAVCAKTFAYATGCRLFAIDTFLAVAENSPTSVESLQIVGDAQRGDLYVGRYLRGPDRGFHRQGEIRITPSREWCESLQADDVLSGPGIELLEEGLPQTCRVLDASARHPSATVIARLGAERTEASNEIDIWSLEPFYLRKSYAEEKEESRNNSRVS